MVFVRLPFLPPSSTSSLLAVNGGTVGECSRTVEEKTSIPASWLIFYCNGRRVVPSDCIAASDAVLEATLAGGLSGGKGGFGSMLRALGAQIEKTTNREACRDLSGRRLRDINEEERLRRYVAEQAQREQEAEERKREKLQRLRRLAEKDNKHEFHDPKYDQEREAATERVHEAMEAAMKASACAATKDESKPSTSGLKRKPEETTAKKSSDVPPHKKEKGLWLGVDLNDSDLDSSSDEEEEAKKKK